MDNYEISSGEGYATSQAILRQGSLHMFENSPYSVTMTGQLPRVFALTICAYRLPGMDEEAYHRYTSEKHALLVKELLIKKRILGYTMTHNTTGTRQMMNQIFGDFPETGMADFDCLIQITFRDVQDYIDVRQDPVYREVISPDHGNFADLARTKMVIGWLETHMADGKLL